MLTINIIGCGKLGKTLDKLIVQQHAATIQNIVNSTLDSSIAAANFITEGTPLSSIHELTPADITIISTKDNKIETLCHQLVTNHLLKPSSLILHCSGALSSDILQSAKSLNCLIASVHPVRSFANPEAVARNFTGTLCAFEGDEASFPVLSNLFEKIGAALFKINPQDKKTYHAASVIANNYLVTLHACAVKNFTKAGIDTHIANQLTSQLMNDAYQNLQELPHPLALTGPLQRGDIETVKGHLEALKTDPRSRNVYTALGLETLSITHLPDTVITQLEQILK